MLLLITWIVFLTSNLCLATIRKEQCKFKGDLCQTNEDCCSELSCFIIEKNHRCVPSSINERGKRNSEDLIIPPYYDPQNQLYPYGISRPTLPFYKGQQQQQAKQVSESKKTEWDHCQFHEDCGEGNCCYVHFRFRSLPKWFCRVNRNDIDELCQPLTKYRSLKDIPAWKAQQQENQAGQKRP